MKKSLFYLNNIKRNQAAYRAMLKKHADETLQRQTDSLKNNKLCSFSEHGTK